MLRAGGNPLTPRPAKPAKPLTFGEVATAFFESRSESWTPIHRANWAASVLGVTALGAAVEIESAQSSASCRSPPLTSAPSKRRSGRAGFARRLPQNEPLTALRAFWILPSRAVISQAPTRRFGMSSTRCCRIKFHGKFISRRWTIARFRPSTKSWKPCRILVAPAVRFLILTASRANETLGARWEEIDLDNALWRVPAHRMKGRFPHAVPFRAWP